ncbi:hypothetical protein [Actinokineospora spheciospongiae]|uniref:hypothetical protein n=1 Tax=Actinokineospora spheciospongiae TaxID=909613 RepID=UPI00190F2D01|nr:hypothetical protein [Actinokineospora spheciospongiae]
MSSGDQPSNSRLSLRRPADGSAKSIDLTHSSGRFSAAYPRTRPSAWRWAVMPLPGATATSVPLPIAATLRRWSRPLGVSAISTKQVPL